MAENRINTEPPSPKQSALWSEWISLNARPHQQLLVILSVCGIAMLGYHLAKGASEYVWLLAFVGLVFYVWLNCLVSFFRRKGALAYTLWSWFFFGVLACILLSGAAWLSGLSIIDLPEYRTLFTANLVFYFIATFLVAIMREVAQITGIEY